MGLKPNKKTNQLQSIYSKRSQEDFKKSIQLLMAIKVMIERKYTQM